MTDRRTGQPDTGERRRQGDLELRIVARIKAVMGERQLSMEAGAQLCGLAYGTFWGALNGRDFRISTLEAIASGLNIPLRDLIKAA